MKNIDLINDKNISGKTDLIVFLSELDLYSSEIKTFEGDKNEF